MVQVHYCLPVTARFLSQSDVLNAQPEGCDAQTMIRSHGIVSGVNRIVNFNCHLEECEQSGLVQLGNRTESPTK